MPTVPSCVALPAPIASARHRPIDPGDDDVFSGHWRAAGEPQSSAGRGCGPAGGADPADPSQRERDPPEAAGAEPTSSIAAATDDGAYAGDSPGVGCAGAAGRAPPASIGCDRRARDGIPGAEAFAPAVAFRSGGQAAPLAAGPPGAAPGGGTGPAGLAPAGLRPSAPSAARPDPRVQPTAPPPPGDAGEPGLIGVTPMPSGAALFGAGASAAADQPSSPHGNDALGAVLDGPVGSDGRVPADLHGDDPPPGRPHPDARSVAAPPPAATADQGRGEPWHRPAPEPAREARLRQQAFPVGDTDARDGRPGRLPPMAERRPHGPGPILASADVPRPGAAPVSVPIDGERAAPGAVALSDRDVRGALLAAVAFPLSAWVAAAGPYSTGSSGTSGAPSRAATGPALDPAIDAAEAGRERRAAAVDAAALTAAAGRAVAPEGFRLDGRPGSGPAGRVAEVAGAQGHGAPTGGADGPVSGWPSLRGRPAPTGPAERAAARGSTVPTLAAAAATAAATAADPCPAATSVVGPGPLALIDSRGSAGTDGVGPFRAAPTAPTARSSAPSARPASDAAGHAGRAVPDRAGDGSGAGPIAPDRPLSHRLVLPRSDVAGPPGSCDSASTGFGSGGIPPKPADPAQRRAALPNGLSEVAAVPSRPSGDRPSASGAGGALSAAAIAAQGRAGDAPNPAPPGTVRHDPPSTGVRAGDRQTGGADPPRRVPAGSVLAAPTLADPPAAAMRVVDPAPACDPAPPAASTAAGGGERAVGQPFRADPPGPAVARQVADSLAALPGAGLRPARVEIVLDPPELGRVSIRLDRDGPSATLAVLVDRPETLDLMRRNLDALDAALRQAGHEGLQLSLGGRQPGFGSQAAAGGPPLPEPAALPPDHTALDEPAGFADRARPRPPDRLDLRL